MTRFGLLISKNIFSCGKGDLSTHRWRLDSRLNSVGYLRISAVKIRYIFVVLTRKVRKESSLCTLLHTPLIVPARIVSACGVVVEAAGTDGIRIEIRSPRELTTTPLEKDKPKASSSGDTSATAAQRFFSFSYEREASHRSGKLSQSTSSRPRAILSHWSWYNVLVMCFGNSSVQRTASAAYIIVACQARKLRCVSSQKISSR